MRSAPRIPPQHFAFVAILVLVLSVYWQVGGHAFINIDDDKYITGNPFVLRGLTLDGVSWAFTTFHAGNWHPLTWLSHMLDVELFGPAPGWHHRVNVLYHLLNSELLFLVLWRMTGGLWRSAFAAALFGVHPLHVESVAWVAERKDVLSTLFWVLAMAAYLRYARRPGIGRYLLVAVPFGMGLMCKPMPVTLPFLLLLLDWWPLGRMATHDSTPWRFSAAAATRLAWEKVPLLGLSAISSAITYLAQARGGAVSQFEQLPLASRISNALVSYVVYLWKAAWPSALAVYYPHPVSIHAGLPALEVAGSIALLSALSVFALREVHRRPCIAVGWLWYVGTLIPVIGLIQAGSQAYADRYTYVPLVGVFIAVAWGIPPELSARRRSRFALSACAVASLVALSMAARVQAGYWRDSETLLSRAVAVTDRNWFALNNLGVSHERLGRYPQAAGFYREALRIKPDYVDAWYNLGVSSDRLGQSRQAIGYYREALRIRPDFADAWYNLGVSYGKLGQYTEAIASYRELLRIKPEDADAWCNLGVSYGNLGRYWEAIGCFREALRIRPDFAEARNNLDTAIARLGRPR